MAWVTGIVAKQFLDAAKCMNVVTRLRAPLEKTTHRL